MNVEFNLYANGKLFLIFPFNMDFVPTIGDNVWAVDIFFKYIKAYNIPNPEFLFIDEKSFLTLEDMREVSYKVYERFLDEDMNIRINLEAVGLEYKLLKERLIEIDFYDVDRCINYLKENIKRGAYNKPQLDINE